jgi:plastocyanin
MYGFNVGRGVTWLAAVLAISIAGCGDDSGTDPDGGGGGGGGGGTRVATTSVTVQGTNSFDPANIQVSPGATVTWTWAANAGAHDVTFPSTAIADSGARSSGAFSTAMPTAPGTYTYSCTLHPGMNGSVLVQ